MSEAENKALVRRLLEDLRDGWHPVTIEKYFAPGPTSYGKCAAPRPHPDGNATSVEAAWAELTRPGRNPPSKHALARDAAGGVGRR